MTVGDVKERLTGFDDKAQVIMDDSGQILDFRIVNENGICKFILSSVDEEDDFDFMSSYSSEDEVLSEDTCDSVLDDIDEI